MSPALPAMKFPLVVFLSVTTSSRALKILDTHIVKIDFDVDVPPRATLCG